MTHRWKTLAATASTIAMLGAGAAWAEGATVVVSLWDRGEMADMMMGQMPNMPEGMGMGMAMHGEGGAMGVGSAGPMGVTLDVTEVSAGPVTFEVTNDSAGMVHELVVLPIADTEMLLPYNNDEYRVEEEGLSLGEVSELEPGEGGALTLNLDPGTYMLMCNVPGHYVLGMWTLLTVTE